MMQRDEDYLLRPWLAYHGHLFGFENIYVLDNGSSSPGVRAALQEFAGKGVHVIWDFAAREDYLAKGNLVGGTLKVLDDSRQYDFLIPLDCDEFVVLRNEYDVDCSRDTILSYLVTLTGETRTLRFPYQFANHPLEPDLYHRYMFFKVFFAAGTVAPMDHGHHMAVREPGIGVRDTKLIHLHFHHKMHDINVARARRSWIGSADLDNHDELAAYGGLSSHLTPYFLRGKDDYYRSFLNKPHFYLPHFRALLRELGAPIDLPTEQIAEDLKFHIAAAEPSLGHESNGGIVLIPLDPGAQTAVFRTARFHEAHYLAANPELAAAGIDPTLHFCDGGFKVGRPLRLMP